MSDTEIINTFYDKREQKIPSMKWRLQNERQDILALVVKTTEANTSTSEP